MNVFGLAHFGSCWFPAFHNRSIRVYSVTQVLFLLFCVFFFFNLVIMSCIDLLRRENRQIQMWAEVLAKPLVHGIHTVSVLGLADSIWPLNVEHQLLPATSSSTSPESEMLQIWRMCLAKQNLPKYKISVMNQRHFFLICLLITIWANLAQQGGRWNRAWGSRTFPFLYSQCSLPSKLPGMTLPVLGLQTKLLQCWENLLLS